MIATGLAASDQAIFDLDFYAVMHWGRDQPTVIITNADQIKTKALIERYARRMTIEQRLAEIIRCFCADALSSTVNLDITLCVLAQALLAAFRARLGNGYATGGTDADSTSYSASSKGRKSCAEIRVRDPLADTLNEQRMHLIEGEFDADLGVGVRRVVSGVRAAGSGRIPRPGARCWAGSTDRA